MNECASIGSVSTGNDIGSMRLLSRTLSDKILSFKRSFQQNFMQKRSFSSIIALA